MYCSRKFDQAAPVRRLGQLSKEQVRLEFRQRVTALRCFRRGDAYDPQLPDALWRAYLMVLEDEGRNSAQLRGAGLLPLLQSYIRHRLRNPAKNDGWPLEDETNTLVVVLFFLLSSQGKAFASSMPEYLVYHFRSSICTGRVG
jgi:hypothetical protein